MAGLASQQLSQIVITIVGPIHECSEQRLRLDNPFLGWGLLGGKIGLHLQK